MAAKSKSALLLAVQFVAFLFLECSNARAAWFTKTDGPDVFGQTKVIVATSGDQDSMVIQCDDQDKLFVALIFPKKKFDDIPTLPAELLLQIDGGVPIRLSAELRSWNDNYIGVVAEGRTTEVIRAVKAIGNASQRVSAGFSVGTVRDSAEFDADGSTVSVEEAFRGCKLAAPVRPPAS